MIKGWKLDPAWREYYERRDRERKQRRAVIGRAVSQVKMAESLLDASIRHRSEVEVKMAHTLGRMQAEAEERNARIRLASNALRRIEFGGER